jgi:hypothetical protein
MGMKGISGILATVFVLLVVVLVVVSTDVVLILQEGTTKNANIQATIYTMKNTMDAAELYMNISLDYSVYQACYVILRWGGYKEDNKNWSNTEDSSEEPPTDEQFKERLQELIQRYMNRYTSKSYNFMDQYNASTQDSNSLPEIRFTSFDADYTDLSFTVESEDKIYLRETIDEYKEEIILVKDFNTERIYDIPCFGLFSWGKNNHDDIKSVVTQEVTSETEKWPTGNPAERSYTGSCGTREIADRMFHEVAEDLIEEPDFGIPEGIYFEGEPWENALQKGEDRIKDDLESSLFSAIFALNELSIQSYVMSPAIDVVVDIIPNCQEEERDGSCYYSCTKFEYVIETQVRTNLAEKIDENNELRYYPVSIKGYPDFGRMQLTITDRIDYSK